MDVHKPNLEYKNTVIFVVDVEKSKNFYIDVMNQEIEMDFGRNVGFKSGLAIWKSDYAINLINQAARSEIHKISSNQKDIAKLELYFETPEIIKFQTSLKEEGIEFIHECITQPWQQRALRFFDPDGHIIEVAEPMSVVVLRLSKEGLTPEEIHEKSMMPLEVINEILKK